MAGEPNMQMTTPCGISFQAEEPELLPPSPVLYTILPSIIRNRLFPLRKSVSEYTLRSQTQSSIIHRRNESSEPSSPSTNMDLAVLPHMGSKYAQHGSSLLQAALSESEHPDPQSQAFSRQLYMSSLTYLLRGLPPSLTSQESGHLRLALPQDLQEPRSSYSAIEPAYQTSSSSNLVHRGVSTAIILFCLLLRLVLPYIKYFLAVAHDYERTHHVAEKALALGVGAADTAGRRSLEILGTAAENKIMVGAVQYCVEGICGGLTEGLGVGMKAIEERRDR